MIKKNINILLSLLVVLFLYACDDSLGTDPDYKQTIIENDTIFKFVTDTIVEIDTVLSSDSAKYLIKIDSLITTRDSLGTVIDSLTKHIKDLETIDVAPKFLMRVDSILTSVRYTMIDSLYDVNQQMYMDTVEKNALFQPFQDSLESFRVELDTNLGVKKAWLNLLFDGKFQNRIMNDMQDIYIVDSRILLDNVLIYNNYYLSENGSIGDKKQHTTTVLTRDNMNITQQTNKTAIVSFEDYRFGANNQLIGFNIALDYVVENKSLQLNSTKSKYHIEIILSFP